MEKRGLRRFKTQKMCNEAVELDPCSVAFVHGHLKKQEMCNKAVHNRPNILEYISEHFKT